MANFHAVRWSEEYNPPLTHPLLYATILDGCQEHRPWYPDALWDEGPNTRRAYANAYIVDAMFKGSVWSVLQNAAIVGIFILNHVRPGADGQGHFIFFDRQLRNKRLLCLEVMRAEFEHFQLEMLRAEIPEYASALTTFLRRGLGFQYESERKLSDPKQAKQASIKHRAVRYKGAWNDTYLMSISREEFHSFVRSLDQSLVRERRPDAGPHGTDAELPASHSGEPAGSDQPTEPRI